MFINMKRNSPGKIRNMLFVSPGKNRKYLSLLALLTLLVFTGCRQNGFTVTGTIEGPAKVSICF